MRNPRWFARLEYWLALPIAFLLLVLAEYSRYLIVYDWQRTIFAPRTLAIVAVIVLALWCGSAIKLKRIRFNTHDLWWLGVPILLATWALVSLIWFDSETARIYLTEFWLYGLLLTLLIGVLGRRAHNKEVLLFAALIGAAGVITIAIVEKITDVHLPFSNLHNPYREQWAITSVFINQNHLAAHIGLVLPIFAGAALAYRKLRWYLWTIFGLGLIALFFTGSILAVGGTILAGIVFATTALLRNNKIKRNARAIGALVLITLVAIGVAWFALPDNVAERFSVQAEGVQKSIAERTQLVRDGVQLVLEHPWIGHGAGAAEAAVRSIGNTRVQNLHNLTIEIAVNFGLLAAIALVVWWLALAVRALRSRSYIAIGTGASLIGLLLIQAAPSSFVGVRMPFIVLGLAIVFTDLHDSRSARIQAKN